VSVKKKRTDTENKQIAMVSKELGKHELNWEAKFAKLAAYKKLHGHCNVSRKDDRELVVWVSTLRTEHRFLREGRPSYLTPERIQRLIALGFEWEVAKTKPLNFEKRLKQLAEYKAKHGHCNVPQKCTDCPPGLGNFVLEQRRIYKARAAGDEKMAKKMSQERIDALEALGFQWKLRNRHNGGGKEEKLQETSDLIQV
jgi:hypothetical protein